MAYKVKICDRFNTIEWETEEPPYPAEMQDMWNRLAVLKLDLEEQAEERRKLAAQQEANLPTEKQWYTMKNMGIDIPMGCTRDQARAIIGEALVKQKKSKACADLVAGTDGIPF